MTGMTMEFLKMNKLINVSRHLSTILLTPCMSISQKKIWKVCFRKSWPKEGKRETPLVWLFPNSLPLLGNTFDFFRLSTSIHFLGSQSYKIPSPSQYYNFKIKKIQYWECKRRDLDHIAKESLTDKRINFWNQKRLIFLFILWFGKYK